MINPMVMEFGVDIASALSVLTDVGILPVITVAAVLGLATMIYKRFRK